ncbi:MAG: SUMF1/EgtB/PvdO family nonheme iron enzyme [Bacteroidaceae bacterium]|nr:SUMF1/EgtB/PvdO family nonheme iron enzyme [Bacteroidaceae bacterium]
MMADIINPLSQGTRLIGPQNTYQIQRTLGQGTFGITYLATTEMQLSGQMGSFTTRVQVAVKEFFMKDFNGREGSEVTAGSQGGYFVDYKKKFLREAENLAKLQHPHIVKVLESFEANGTAYYAMEYLEGGSLEGYIEKHGALSESEVMGIAQQIGEALEFMHAHKMLHLDLKPANVMLRSADDAVLIDFGLSKQFDKNGAPESSTTIGGGTPGYAPLEQANYQRGDGLPVTMDVYAFGATIYKMLTGERPPEASEVLNDGFPAFVLQKHGVSTGTMAVIEKAMQPMRKKRCQSVREVLEALELLKQAVPEPEKDEEDHDTAPAAAEETTFTIPRKQSAAGSAVKVDGKALMKWLLRLLAVLAVLGGILLIIFFLPRSCSVPNTPADTPSDSLSAADSLATAVSEEQKPYVEDSLGNRTYTVNGVSFKMIRVEAGTFEMGEKKYDVPDAKPVHIVTLTQDFYIGETEVTQALWQAVMDSNPSYFKGEDLPVESISWDDCLLFIQQMNSLTGSLFTLPSEAQWEFAARGGNQSKGYTYCGSNKHSEVSWTQSTGSTKTHPVATKIPNELGLYDMGGNVLEPCSDWYANYPSSAQTDPTGPVQGESHVARGGGYLDLGFLTLPSVRYTYRKYRDQGLRLALTEKGNL